MMKAADAAGLWSDQDRHGMPFSRAIRRRAVIEHDPEKWKPVFGKAFPRA